MAEELELTDEQKERLSKFDPAKPLVIAATEIEGLETFMGRFVFRRPTVADRIKIGIKTAKLTENIKLDNLHENMAYILATFEVVCTETPSGFTFDGLYDLTPLFLLHDRYVEWLEFFRLKLQQGKEATS